MAKRNRAVYVPIPADKAAAMGEKNGGVATDVKVETFYSMGGINYFTGTSDPRGYFVSVKVVEREVSDGPFKTERFLLFSNGWKSLLRPAARFSVGVLDKVAAVVADNADVLATAFMADDKATLSPLLADLRVAAGSEARAA
jgi:hypothetical protein